MMEPENTRAELGIPLSALDAEKLISVISESTKRSDFLKAWLQYRGFEYDSENYKMSRFALEIFMAGKIFNAIKTGGVEFEFE